jgi:hypothetical protein
MTHLYIVSYCVKMKSERQSCTYIDEIDRKVRCATKERLLRIIGRFEVTDRDGRPL